MSLINGNDRNTLQPKFLSVLQRLEDETNHPAYAVDLLRYLADLIESEEQEKYRVLGRMLRAERASNIEYLTRVDKK